MSTEYKDPLHDETMGCYILRFVLSAFLALCIEVPTLFMSYYIVLRMPDLFPVEQVFDFCFKYYPIALLFPVVVGIYGVFKFDTVEMVTKWIFSQFSDRNFIF